MKNSVNINLDDITTLLFDMDNTLILFDEKKFVKNYTGLIHRYFVEEIPDPAYFTQVFLKSTSKMFEKPKDHQTNLDKFALDFSQYCSCSIEEIRERFLTFYQKEFKELQTIISLTPFAVPLLKLAQKYFTLVLATNPLFPAIANLNRLSWAGLGTNMIEWEEITSADEYHFTKPDTEYYEEIIRKIDRTPPECLMIGNDPINDMVAGKIGIKTMLITSSPHTDKILQTDLDRQNREFPVDYQGTLEDLFNAIQHHRGN